MEFIMREDVMAEQGPNGAYYPTREWGNPHTKVYDGPLIPFTMRSIKAHLEGETTYGHYLLKGNKCKMFAFDIDLDGGEFLVEDWRSPLDGLVIDPRAIMRDMDHQHRPELIRMLRSLADGFQSAIDRDVKGVKTAVSFSGSKGMHVYALYGKPVLAEVAVKDAKSVITYFARVPGIGFAPKDKSGHQWAHQVMPGITVEIFPKQDEVREGGFGNLMRLPLGFHKKTGFASHFIDTSAPMDQLVEVPLQEIFT